MKTTTNDTDRLFLDKIANGDEHAFALLLDQYRDKVFAHALTYVKFHDEAVELVQDIFVKVWVQRERLLEVRDFPAYLFILSRNQLVSAIRKRVTERVAIPDENILHEIVRPDNNLEAKELERRLNTAIEQLPTQQRTVFSLSRDARLTQDEIAEKMGITKRTVKFHMAAALNFLRIFLKNSYSVLLIILFFFKKL